MCWMNLPEGELLSTTILSVGCVAQIEDARCEFVPCKDASYLIKPCKCIHYWLNYNYFIGKRCRQLHLCTSCEVISAFVFKYI